MKNFGQAYEEISETLVEGLVSNLIIKSMENPGPEHGTSFLV